VGHVASNLGIIGIIHPNSSQPVVKFHNQNASIRHVIKLWYTALDRDQYIVYSSVSNISMSGYLSRQFTYQLSNMLLFGDGASERRPLSISSSDFFNFPK
jgi:hypothetical protein